MARVGLYELERLVVDVLLEDREADAAALAPDAGPYPPVSGALVADLLGSDTVAGRFGPRRVSLRGFRIDGPLDLAASAAIRPLELTDCRAGELSFENGTTRDIILNDCQLDALSLKGASVEGSVKLSGGRTSGRIDLIDASITNTLNLDGHGVRGSGGVAIEGDRVSVGRALFLRRGFTAEGDIRLVSAAIGGELSCDGAGLRGLDLDGATIGGRLFLRTIKEMPFTATGRVRLTGAKARGPVEIGGTLSGTPALQAGGMVVETALVLQPELRAHGEVALKGARVEGRLECRAAELHNAGGKALDLTSLHVHGTLRVTPGSVQGKILLIDARSGRFEDDPAHPPSDLHLDGFTYESIGVCDGDEPPAKKRLAQLGGPYRPQPYEALASAYRRDGREEDARLVGIHKQRQRTRSLSWWRRPWGWALDALVGYGYVPARALLLLGLLLVAGTLLFADLHASGALQARGGASPEPVFSPVLYSFDLLLPVISLRQRDAWVPVEFAAQVWMAVFIVVGWIIATAVAAALAGVVRRN
jgi:hypothetical protein